MLCLMLPEEKTVTLSMIISYQFLPPDHNTEHICIKRVRIKSCIYHSTIHHQRDLPTCEQIDGLLSQEMQYCPAPAPVHFLQTPLTMPYFAVLDTLHEVQVPSARQKSQFSGHLIQDFPVLSNVKPRSHCMGHVDGL